MVLLYPKAFKKSQKDSILEDDRRGFVTLSDHCALTSKLNSNEPKRYQCRIVTTFKTSRAKRRINVRSPKHFEKNDHGNFSHSLKSPSLKNHGRKFDGESRRPKVCAAAVFL